jgi:prophage maintenance system killer protein
VYYFGSIMNAQPFPDGNKRVARTVYALMMLSGGIKFQAPSADVGRQLANM